MSETTEHLDVILHEPGKCPEIFYGNNCDGIGHWQEDPYASEIYDDHTESFICDGVEYGSAMDI